MGDPNGSFLGNLFGKIKTNFSNALTSFNKNNNELIRFQTKMKKQLEEKEKQGVLVQGIKRAFLGRYYGLVQSQQVVQKAEDGLQWVLYFVRAPNLQQDLGSALFSFAQSKLNLSNISLPNLKRVVATTGGTSPQDIKDTQQIVRRRVYNESKILGVSISTGVAVSQFLKMVGKTAQSQIIKTGSARVRMVWSVLGVFSMMFGLSKISDAMGETDGFSNFLMPYREKQNAGLNNALRKYAERFQSEFPEQF